MGDFLGSAAYVSESPLSDTLESIAVNRFQDGTWTVHGADTFHLRGAEGAGGAADPRTFYINLSWGLSGNAAPSAPSALRDTQTQKTPLGSGAWLDLLGFSGCPVHGCHL